MSKILKGVVKATTASLRLCKPENLRVDWLIGIRKGIFGLTQQEFADVLYMSLDTYQRREANPNTLSALEYRHVQAVLEAHGLDSQGRMLAAKVVA